MPTTTNYSWTLPTVGGSVNTWGTLVNNILTDIDAKMFPRTGGTITGNTSVTGTLSATGVISTDASGGTSLSFRTSGTQNYSWANQYPAAGNFSLYDHALAASVLTVSSGNLGLGVTPSAWGAPALQLPNGVGLFSYASTPTTNLGQNVYAAAANGTLRYIGNGTATIYLQQSGAHYWYTAPSGTAGNAISFTQAMTLDASGNLLPGANGTQAFGSTSLRWAQVWCTAGAFNTSDAALKTPIRSMQSAELAAGYQMAQELGTFQWLESVKEKGDKARRHVGLTVQRAAEILEAHGLDAWSYGFMGYDKWPAVTEIADATEEDEGAYQEKVTQQKTVKQTSQTQTVEVINGKPTLKVETVESDVPVTEQIQVIDAEGKLVFTTVAEVPAVFDDEGNEVSPAVPAHMVPMMHAVPVMETVTVWKRVKEVRPAGESYAFRSDQLAFFIAAGVAAKVGA